MSAVREVVVSGAFDDIRCRDLRFLQEASKLGKLTVLLWRDDSVLEFTGKTSKFPLAERKYLLDANRFVNKVHIAELHFNPDELPAGLQADVWADCASIGSAPRQAFCKARNVEYRRFLAEELDGFPEIPPSAPTPDHKKVIVTGCFDWLHSGHVRFFEEVAGYGDLIVVIGHDANIKLLKGEGHPMQPQDERRYAVASVKYVNQAIISSGHGWLDAEPEIQNLKPDIYAVNDDGDHPSKRQYCQANGISYVVLRRTPAKGLSRRSSTDLRGF
jgi:cytidyltransferase-like protein